MMKNTNTEPEREAKILFPNTAISLRRNGSIAFKVPVPYKVAQTRGSYYNMPCPDIPII